MIHLRGRQADVVIDSSLGVPVIAYWGAPLGEVDPGSVAAALERPTVQGTIGVVAPISVVPEHGSGFQGSPGLSGARRGGVSWAPRFSKSGVTVFDDGVVVDARDSVASLLLSTRITLGDVLTVTCTLTNEGSGRYLLDGLHPTLPLLAHAAELMTFDGRWTREFHPVRRPWGSGSWIGENRAGRTSPDPAPWPGWTARCRHCRRSSPRAAAGSAPDRRPGRTSRTR